jgi:hypothetical protein
VPIDRAFTRVFFGWHGPQFQQKNVFYAAYEHFAKVAREANPARFIGAGWRTSLTKNIDNALVRPLPGGTTSNPNSAQDLLMATRLAAFYPNKSGSLGIVLLRAAFKTFTESFRVKTPTL